MTQAKPVYLSLRQLLYLTEPVHLWNKADVDNLHDVWLRGSPSPDSIVRVAAGYDPRLAQKGADERRLILYVVLEQWLEDVGKRRGFSPEQIQKCKLAIEKVSYSRRIGV